MGEEFCWEELSPSLFICVSSAHKFGTDAFCSLILPLPGGKIFAVIWEPAAVSSALWFRDDPPRLCYGADIPKAGN